MPSARLRSVSSPSAITYGHVAVLALALVGCGLSGPVDPFRAHYISVEGRVTDESGAGVADAQVGITSVFADASGVCGPAGGTPHASVLSRGRGSFSHVFEYLTGATSRSCITVTVAPPTGSGFQVATVTRPPLNPSATRSAAVVRFDVVLSR